MKLKLILLAIVAALLPSCQATKRAGECTTTAGFAVMEAGVKPIDVVDRVQGQARFPVKLITLPVCLALAGTGIIIGAPLVVVGTMMEGEFNP
jgi:hypothetical protein